MWMSAELRGVVPFDPWSFGLWGRYDLPIRDPDDAQRGTSFTSFCAGLTFGRRLFRFGPVDIAASPEPSVGAVMLAYGAYDQSRVSEATVALWLGAGLEGSFPLGGIFRGVVALQGDVAPLGLSDAVPSYSGGVEPPSYPTYAVGLSVGVEAMIR
jgi:hypothetical protein